ncbi:MAG: ABC transporter ATP-binding protein [Coriobacteriia bacterium]|nr:ABC transporter ATP-binding protein [Coriobacteriia bacterium]MBN2823375.1 ABC transporter ATP-binding protein [Coriobacteriia bacterium]
MSCFQPLRGISEVRRILAMLSLKRKEIGLLVLLAVLYALFEGVGVGMLAPVLQFIETGAETSGMNSGIWQLLRSVTDALGIPITLLTLLVMAFLPILIRQVVYFAYSYYGARIQQRVAKRLRVQGFSALVHGDLAHVVLQGHGNLVSCLTAQVQRGGQAIYQFVQLISLSVLVFMYVAVLLILQPALTVISIIMVVFISFLVKGSIKRSRRLGQETAERNNEAYTVIGERIDAIRLIKMLGQEDAETDRVSNVISRLEEVQVKIAISRGVIEVTVDPAQMFAMFGTVYLGVEFFHVSLSSLGLFLFILLRLNQKAKELSMGRQLLSANIDSLEMVNDTIQQARASRVILGGERRFEGLTRGIEFKDVSFSYHDEGSEERVLKGIDLSVPAGTQVAIVGRSGAGKSTLVDLLPRLKEPTGGDVFFDDVPASEFDLVSLRRSIGFMTQDAVLFNASVLYNLTYGLERTPTEDEVRMALAKSWAVDFVDKLPNGLETIVGDRGVRLSGGQRQRLALARVFLQDPDILILDEPTSALDSESEDYIQRALSGWHGEKTIIVIAHRLSTVQRSDSIVVLDGGKIVESGRHDDLLESNGVYRQLFDLQVYG